MSLDRTDGIHDDPSCLPCFQLFVLYFEVVSYPPRQPGLRDEDPLQSNIESQHASGGQIQEWIYLSFGVSL